MSSTSFHPKESVRKLREESADSPYPSMEPTDVQPPKVAIGPDQHITCPYCGQCMSIE